MQSMSDSDQSDNKVRKLFRIKYTEPETLDEKTVYLEFEDSVEFPAEEWAEDKAYSLADKGPHSVNEVINPTLREQVEIELCLGRKWNYARQELES